MIKSKDGQKYIIQEGKAREIFKRVTGHFPDEKL